MKKKKREKRVKAIVELRGKILFVGGCAQEMDINHLKVLLAALSLLKKKYITR